MSELFVLIMLIGGIWFFIKLFSSAGKVPTVSEKKLVFENLNSTKTDSRLNNDVLIIRFNGNGVERLIPLIKEGDVVDLWRNSDERPQVRVYIPGQRYFSEQANLLSVMRTEPIYTWASYKGLKGYKHWYEIFDITSEGAKIRRIEVIDNSFRTKEQRRNELLDSIAVEPKYRVLKSTIFTKVDFQIGPNKDNDFLELRLKKGINIIQVANEYIDKIEERNKMAEMRFDEAMRFDDPRLNYIAVNSSPHFELYYKDRKCNVSNIEVKEDFEKFLKLWTHFQPCRIEVRKRTRYEDGAAVLLEVRFE